MKAGWREGWRARAGRLEGGMLEGWKGWKARRLEGWKAVRLESWNGGRAEGWKVEGWKAQKPETCRLEGCRKLEGWIVFRIFLSWAAPGQCC